MLNKVLEIINKESNFSSRFIARQLNLQETMVDDLKNKLISMGYIAKISCDMSACEKCSCGCSSKKLNDKVDYEITKKGYNLLNKIRR
ncbi:FeoC-like transcriptional regulator [Clostridium sp. SHJSY1]|uniref:FeoC-like transcriptional regulator n=1 Tax=Clostridium sp. SHJSY1 TaxID=2942483 RepID=UPI002876095B|nr:FeoC-like transcriptional regulator [Clostridium sp. SHJSY1]MDS0526615.1 FeoC-like transcriptional regulator [Clostridium sp. SHJSY1]